MVECRPELIGAPSARFSAMVYSSDALETALRHEGAEVSVEARVVGRNVIVASTFCVSLDHASVYIET